MSTLLRVLLKSNCIAPYYTYSIYHVYVQKQQNLKVNELKKHFALELIRNGGHHGKKLRREHQSRASLRSDSTTT